MDTDIFTAQSTPGAAPNVLIVLDNTSNWSRQDQHWPGGLQQGQAEADAIKQVIQNLPGSINVGLMEFVTGGPAGDNGGFVRFAVSPVGQGQGSTAATNRSSFSTTLTTIYNNVTSPNEKTNSGMAYGNLLYDAYNYLAGATPFASSGDVVSSIADSRGYATNYTRFKSPLSSATSCGTTYIIFIGNPASKGPSADDAANTAALSAVGGNTRQLKLPIYTAAAQNLATKLGYSASCYTTAPTSTPIDYSSLCPPNSTIYDSCTFSSTDTSTALAACTTGARYSVFASIPVTTTSTSSTVLATNQSTTNSCYASSTNWTSSDTGTAPACPASTSTTSGNVTTNTTYSCSYAVGSTAASSCSAAVTGPTAGSPSTQTALTSSCYAGNGNNAWDSNTNDYGGMACPANPAPITSAGVTTTTTNQCTFTGTAGGSTSGCAHNNESHWSVNMTVTPMVTRSTAQSKYPLTQTVTKTVQTITTIGSSQTSLGNTAACYSSLASCSTSDYSCPAGSTCTCGSPTTTTGICPAGARYQVLGNVAVTLESPTGTFATDTAPYNADEWARFLHEVGVPDWYRR